MNGLNIRKASVLDLESIRYIYNQGIEDRIATLETDIKDLTYMQDWLLKREKRYVVMVAEVSDRVVGWASLNPCLHR